MKKILAFALCLVMVLSLSSMTFAAEEKSITLTSDNLLVGESKAYQAGSATVDGIDFSFTELGDYGNGLQMRTKNGNSTSIFNTVAIPGNITKIVLVHNADKDINVVTDCFSFTFGTTADALNAEVKLSTVAGTKEYTVTAPEGEFSYFKMLHTATKSFYWDSITIYYSDSTGSTKPTEAPTEPPVIPTITANKVDALTDGMKIVIYNPGNGVINTNVEYLYESKNKWELKTVAATVEGTVLTAPKADAGILTVKVVDGHYSFVNEAGKYLYLDTTDVKFVDEAGEYTLFDLVSVEGGYYIKSTNAVYSSGDSVKDQYLEYYSGYYTVYSLNESKPELYVFNFYEVDVKNVDTGDIFGIVLAALAVSGMGITAVVSKKKH